MNWVTGAVRLIPLIITAVQAVERLASAKKGKEKQEAAIGIIGDLVPMIEASINKEVVNEAAVQDAIRKVIDAVVSLQNVVRDVSMKRAA